MLTRQTNEKICQVYKTFMIMYKKMDNEFFIFNDFNGNEAVLYTIKVKFSYLIVYKFQKSK